MQMRIENVCSLADLKFVSVRCQHCKTTVTLDLRKLPKMTQRRPDSEDDSLITEDCPACRKPYDSAIGKGLGQMHRAFETLAPVTRDIEFRGDAEPSGGM